MSRRPSEEQDHTKSACSVNDKTQCSDDTSLEEINFQCWYYLAGSEAKILLILTNSNSQPTQPKRKVALIIP